MCVADRFWPTRWPCIEDWLGNYHHPNQRPAFEKHHEKRTFQIRIYEGDQMVRLEFLLMVIMIGWGSQQDQLKLQNLPLLYHREWYIFHADTLSPRRQLKSVGKFERIIIYYLHIPTHNRKHIIIGALIQITQCWPILHPFRYKAWTSVRLKCVAYQGKNVWMIELWPNPKFFWEPLHRTVYSLVFILMYPKHKQRTVVKS